jgi:translation initiation factor IF-2
MQDFAGSTAVHLIGATGALAALLILGPRKGKYGPDGKPFVAESEAEALRATVPAPVADPEPVDAATDPTADIEARIADSGTVNAQVRANRAKADAEARIEAERKAAEQRLIDAEAKRIADLAKAQAKADAEKKAEADRQEQLRIEAEKNHLAKIAASIQESKDRMREAEIKAEAEKKAMLEAQAKKDRESAEALKKEQARIAAEKADEEKPENNKKIEEILNKEKTGDLLVRPPVIVVMGHVDHGKTKLLDAIRKTNVVAGEHGGITQHIGAYQVVRRGRPITFIDTPGHEAFTAMRSRGAKIADVAILVVAADDGVQPQTIEAYKIIQAAGLPFIVAINKIDKPTADLNKAKQDLVNKLELLPEDWGGKTVCAPVSALAGKGIEELLDLILLSADADAKSMKANPDADAVGTIIESRIDKNSGPVATMLVQNGTLRIGDQLVMGGNIIGKARSLKNYIGEEIKEALPSTPVRILGLKIAPAVGDVIEVGDGERVKGGFKKMTAQHPVLTATKEEAENDNSKKLNLIIKSDVLGSAEAIEESLLKLNNEDVKIKILTKGLGNIIEGDISRAESSDAQIIGFNVKTSTAIEALLREKKVKVSSFNVIYDLIEYIKLEMQKLIVAKIERVDLGRLKVLAVFRTENKSQVIGGKVLDGQAKNKVSVEIIRNKEIIAYGKVASLQSGKMDVPTVDTDQECGLLYEGKPIIAIGDIVQFFEDKETIKKL